MTVEIPATPPLAARLRGVESSPVREILALTEQPGMISFAGGLPAPELFDASGMRAAFAAALADGAAERSLQYSTTEGDPALRAAIAARLTKRGLPSEAGQLLITSGSQQALTLIATVLLEPGDTVLVEEPSYLAALQAFRLAGATVVPVPCDDDGLDPEAAAVLAERHGARLLYTIPTFQNPTGRTLPRERREALVELSRRAGFWLLEDDPYGELRYRGQPLPTLAALDDRVLSLSTLSKIAAPGLRIGWVRAPEPLRCPLTIAKQAADLHSSTVDQAAAAHWLETIDLDARVATLRSVYGARRDALIDGLRDALPPGSAHNRPDGGMFVWARLPDGWDAAELLDRALRRQVAFVPGYPFFAGPPDRAALRLSFTAHDPAEIAEGLVRLRAGGNRLGAADLDVRPLRLLVDVADAREPGQLAGAGAGVEPLRVAALALGQRRRDPHLEERDAGRLVDRAGRGTVAPVGGDQRGERHDARLGEQGGGVGGAADVLRPVLDAEAEIPVETVPEVVAVQPQRGPTRADEQRLELDGQRRLARRGQAREPDGGAPEAERGGAVGGRDRAVVPARVGGLH